jgi:hypothetical protein
MLAKNLVAWRVSSALLKAKFSKLRKNRARKEDVDEVESKGLRV